MKHLTPIYLTLMNAFKDRVDYALSNPNNKHLNRICMMQEYCTLRVDGGRQSGKSEAIAQFCKDWLSDGNDVVVISTNTANSLYLSKRISAEYRSVTRINKTDKSKVIFTTIRDYLSGNSVKFRGIALNRVLIVIDEPLKIPEMYKFYEMYEKYMGMNSFNDLPMFFVIGMQ